MRNLKAILMMSVVLGTSAVTTMNSAQARHYRHASSDYVASDTGCVTPPAHLIFYPWPNFYPTVSYIYPAANWEPFFRRHVYRYGPIVCAQPIEMTTHVISVRY